MLLWSQCLLLLVLVPLHFVSSSTMMPAHCKDKEMICYVNHNCKDPSEEFEMNKVTNDLTCELHVGIRPYTMTKALIRLKSTKEKIIKVGYANENAPLFGCEAFSSQDGTEKIRSSGVQELVRGEIEGAGIACELVYESGSNNLIDPAKELEVTIGATKVPAGDIDQKDVNKFKPCDIDWIPTITKAGGDWIFTEPDKRYAKVVCEKGDLVYDEKGDGDGELVESIECKGDAVPPAFSITVKETPRVVQAQESKKMKVGCRTKGCTQCTTITALDCSVAGACSLPTQAVKEGCNILKCDVKYPFFKTDKTNATKIDDDVSCASHAADGTTTFRWLLKGAPIEKASCVKTAACQDVTPLKIGSGAALNLYAPSLKCAEGEQLKIESWDKPVNEIVCTGETGKWDVDGTDVEAGSSVSCQVPKAAADDAPASASLGQSETIAVAVVGVVIVAVIAALLFVFVYRPKKKKSDAAKKAKTEKTDGATDKSGQSDVRTAIPVGIAPPQTNTNSDNQPAPIKVEIQADLVEKTMIAATPEKKARSVIVDTAILPTPTPTEDQEQRAQKHTEDQKEEKQPKSQSDGSEPRDVRILKNGEAVLVKRTKKKKSGEENKSSHSKAPSGTRKEKEEPKPKPIDNSPKPKVFSLNAKEEKIRKGATVKPTDYPTLAEIDSDWEDYDPVLAAKMGNVEAGKKKNRKGKTTDGKTVPTAVTPDVPDGKRSVDRTQMTRTKNTMDNADNADMDNLVTQLDTTFEQKEADGKKK